MAAHFFAILKMSEMMVEEFKSEHPEQYQNDVNTKLALKSGYKAFKSDSVDYFLEHHEQFPLTLILFYDSDLFNENIMKNLTVKLLDVFVYKYEKKFQKGNYSIKHNRTGEISMQLNNSSLSANSISSFESALSLIYEDVTYF